MGKEETASPHDESGQNGIIETPNVESVDPGTSVSKEEVSKQSTENSKAQSSVIVEPEPSDFTNEKESAPAVSAKRRRLAQDTIGILEDKCAESPRDITTWKELIKEVSAKDNLEELRGVYERMLLVFPTSAKVWIDYINSELANGEFQKSELLFSRCLTKVFDVDLWEVYLGYVRRINNLSENEASWSIISKAYEFALDRIGIDRKSGIIWTQFIDFCNQKPASSTWEQQQKMDILRKNYRKAIAIPIDRLESLWQAYTTFETGLNKSTARKFLAEKSGVYMNARSSLKELNNITQKLDTKTLPSPRKWNKAEQIQSKLWFDWITWEKANPLKLEDTKGVFQRVQYVFRQAVVTMRYFPEVWFESAVYHIENEHTEEAIEILKDGIAANETSFLLSLKLAEIYEQELRKSDVKKVYEQLISNLTTLRYKLTSDNSKSEEQKDSARDITFAYSQYMKAVKRLEGIKEARKIFSQARKLDYSTFQIFVSSALMEYHSSKDSVIATKIFEVGLKRFASEPDYVKEYFGFLILINDETNARALFEKTVPKMDPSSARELYEHLIKYEADYGELSSLVKLESRFQQTYPNERPLGLFSLRYKETHFNPIEYGDLGGRYRAKKEATDHYGQETINDDNNYSTDEGYEETSKPMVSHGTVSVPNGILNLLKMLPPASSYDTMTFNSAKLAHLLRNLKIPEELYNLRD